MRKLAYRPPPASPFEGYRAEAGSRRSSLVQTAGGVVGEGLRLRAGKDGLTRPCDSARNLGFTRDVAGDVARAGEAVRCSGAGAGDGQAGRTLGAVITSGENQNGDGLAFGRKDRTEDGERTVPRASLRQPAWRASSSHPAQDTSTIAGAHPASGGTRRGSRRRFLSGRHRSLIHTSPRGAACSTSLER